MACSLLHCSSSVSETDTDLEQRKKHSGIFQTFWRENFLFLSFKRSGASLFLFITGVAATSVTIERLTNIEQWRAHKGEGRKMNEQMKTEGILQERFSLEGVKYFAGGPQTPALV